MKRLMFLAVLLPVGSMATTMSPRLEDPFVISNFCLVKKELPPGVQFRFLNDTTYEITVKDGTVILSRESDTQVKLPSTFNPSYLPVIMLLKGRKYSSGRNGWYVSDSGEFGNPLASGYSNLSRIGPKGPVEIMPKNESISKKELDSFVEIPMKYYIGEKFVENKLKISIKKLANQEEFEIVNIHPMSALPKGLTITGKKFQNLEKVSLYAAIEFKYNGEIPVLFVKEFDQATIDLPIIKENKFPFYINDQAKCFKISIDEPEVLSRESNQQYYDKYFAHYAEILEGLGMNDDVKEYLERIKKLDLYEVFPLGHIFKGNGRLITECESNFNDFQTLFDKHEVKKVLLEFNRSAPDLRVITIPPEKSVSIDVEVNGIKSKIQILKRYILNNSWQPLAVVENGEQSECDPFCPNVFVEKKINYFKDSKITYPSSLYKNEDLICGMPGNNGREFRPNKTGIYEYSSF